MPVRQRIERLEKQQAKDGLRGANWFDWAFKLRVAGRPRAVAQIEWVMALAEISRDKRATHGQKSDWRRRMANVVPALEGELAGMRERGEPLPDLTGIRALGLLD